MQAILDTALSQNEAVDRQSPKPYYYQSKEYLVLWIPYSVLKPGNRLPTELMTGGH
jgi:DNA-binding GntR family transcriptional regulator